MNIVAIIQARMTSTRLPGKVLKKVLNKTLLEYELERIMRSKLINEVVVATTTNETDDPIVELCNRLGVGVYRGSDENVLSRYYQAAKEYEADIVVRLTSDCPLIDPFVIDHVIDCYLNQPLKYDYVSNTIMRSYPRGMDTEVFSYKVLSEACNEATEYFHKEHVTPFIWGNPERFRLKDVIYSNDSSRHRWTVDTPEDFELIKLIIENIYSQNKQFTLEDILHLVSEHPEWSLINAHIEQKKK